jgi:hypothetical protein
MKFNREQQKELRKIGSNLSRWNCFLKKSVLIWMILC